MEVGQSMTFAMLTTQGSTAYYMSSLDIDSVAQSVKWSGDSAISAGVADGIDVYNFTVIKTANQTYTVLGSMSSFG